MGNKWNELIISSQAIEETKDDVESKVKREEALDYVNSPSSPIHVEDQQENDQQVDGNNKKDANLTLQNDFQKHDVGLFPPVYSKASKLKTEKTYKYNPKPLGKKNNRSFVPEERKTEDYWQKRIKNNVAARKSREDRRKKELEILDRKSQYEKENIQLRLFIEKLQSENQYLLYEINMLRNEGNMLRNEGRNFPKYEI